MARSLGLTAYRALARRGDPPKADPRALRPVGELVWIHAAEPDSLIAVQDLATRLCANRDGIHVLITQGAGAAGPMGNVGSKEQALLFDTIPAEHPESVAAFLDHWAPNSCLWVWGALRPNLVTETHARGCPMILLDADTKGFDGRRDRWLPDLTSHLLSRFSHVIARSEPGRKRLTQIGLPAEKVELATPLVAGGRALPCADSDLTDLTEALGGRPVWFAACAHPSEVPILLQAHLLALRRSHRLLLILNTADPTDRDTAADLAAETGLDVIQWDDGDEPDDATQVMITDDVQDRGLFFRVAPVSFLGGSLVANGQSCDPFEAAALGSAVLYGPKIGQFLPSYSRLAAAGAARIVNDADALGNAVARLIAPDQAASMAHAGWEVTSQGAELTDRIIDLVQDALDMRGRAK